MTSERKTSLAFWAGFWLIWWLAALLVHNSFIVPGPWQVLEQMAAQAAGGVLLANALSTAVMALAALGISLLSALLAASLSFFWHPASVIFNRICSILTSLPNLAYIIVLLFWTGRLQTVLLTVIFLIFPIIYRNLHEEMCGLSKKWGPVWKIYPQPKHVLIFKSLMPMMRPALSASILSASSLSFKAVVMAEIFTSLSSGIGRGMQSARLDLNVAGVLAWCVWLVLLVFIFEKAWEFLLVRVFGKAED